LEVDYIFVDYNRELDNSTSSPQQTKLQQLMKKHVFTT